MLNHDLQGGYMNQVLKKTLISAALSGMFAMNASAAEDKKADKKTEKKAEKKEATKVSNEDSAKKVKCFGINSCKGKSECGVDGAHSCSGANECKGKGWISVSAKECADKKGKVM